MQYNKAIFGEGIKVYNHGTVATGQTLYDFTIGSQNANLSAAYQSQAMKNNGPLPDDLFYWLASEDSPYNRMSFIYRTGTSPNFEYQKIDTPENKKPVPLVLWAGPTKIDPNTYDVDIENGTSFATYANNSRLIFNSSTFNIQTSQTPLWELNYGHSSSVYANGVYSSLPFILDFDYNNFILKIRVGQGNSFVDLAEYTNDSSHYIDSIAIELYTGDVSTGNSRLARQPRTDENGNNIMLMDAGNDGYYVVTDFDYKIPTVYAENYQYPTYRKLARLGTSTTHVLFSGTNVTTNLLNAAPYFFIEDDKWELVNGSYRLKKSGNSVYSEDDFNYIRKLIAYLGFWFTDGGIYNDSEHSYTLNRVDSLLGDYANTYSDEYMIPNHVYQAEIKEGITTGNFTELRIAKDNDQSKWGKDWRQKNGYDGRTPGGGDRPRPTPDPNPISPNSPGFTLAGKGTQCYALTGADMDEIMVDIFGRSGASYKELVEGLAMFGSDPMGAFISYKWYPFAFNPPTSSPLFLGQTIVNESHVYPIINNTNTSLIEFHGSFWFGKDKNFIHSKKTQCRLYLPFYGFYEISMPLILSQVLDIDFHYNVPDETAVWIISFGNVIYDYLECVPSIEIPLTGNNAAMIAQSKKNTALSIATQVASMAASAFTGAAAVKVAGGVTNALQQAGMASAVFASDAGVEASYGYNFAVNAIKAGAGAGVTARGLGLAGVASNALGGGVNIYNTYKQAQLEIANMRVHVPYHGAADATTFLNLEMRPYIQFYIPDMIDGYSETNYKLTVGHACDIWTTLNDMPDNSLCQTSGTADIDTTNMEIAEIQELNEILISGFYK